MLAEGRRRPGSAGRTVAEAHHRPDLSDDAVLGIRLLDHHFHEAHLVVVEDLVRVQHGQRGDIGLIEPRQPLGPGAALERLGGEVPSGVILLVIQGHRHFQALDGAHLLAQSEDVHGPLEGTVPAGMHHEPFAVAAHERVGDQTIPAEPVSVPSRAK